MAIQRNATPSRNNAPNSREAAPVENERDFETISATARAAVSRFGIQTLVSKNGTGGEVFEKIFTEMKNVIETMEIPEAKIGVAKLLKNTCGLSHSAILFYAIAHNRVAVHPLLIEATGNPPEKIVETVGGVRYELTRTVAEVMERTFMTEVTNAISTVLNVDRSVIFNTDGTLVPNEFVVSENSILELVSNCYGACVTDLDFRSGSYSPEAVDVYLTAFPKGQFVTHIHYNGDDVQASDITGLPIRQDICLNTVFQTNAGNSRDVSEIHSQNSTEYSICKVYGYVDFDYVGPRQERNGTFSSQKFIPNFIITGIVSDGRFVTPDLVAMAVRTCLSLNDNMNWMRIFVQKSSRNKNGLDVNDVGALNIDGNLEKSPTDFGKAIDTKAKNFGERELYALIRSLVFDEFVISIDIPRVSPNTWELSFLRYINSKNKIAIERFDDAIVASTNGRYDYVGKIFDNVSNLVHGGYYKAKTDSGTVFRDVRNFASYLAFANHVSATGQQPVLLTQYTNTLFRNSVDIVLRAAERRKYLVDMAGASNLVIKQTYERLSFNADFIRALVDAYGSKFAPMVSDNDSGANDIFATRASAVYSSSLGSSDRVDRQVMHSSRFGGGRGYNRF